MKGICVMIKRLIIDVDGALITGVKIIMGIYQSNNSKENEAIEKEDF